MDLEVCATVSLRIPSTIALELSLEISSTNPLTNFAGKYIWVFFRELI